MSAFHDVHDDAGATEQERLAIVARADRLGFQPWRVATALRISPEQLAAIGLDASDDAARSA